MKEVICWTLFILAVAPVLIYLCVKFGTVAFYKAKEFMEKESK